jgi:hypothetical protein
VHDRVAPAESTNGKDAVPQSTLAAVATPEATSETLLIVAGIGAGLWTVIVPFAAWSLSVPVAFTLTE